MNQSSALASFIKQPINLLDACGVSLQEETGELVILFGHIPWAAISAEQHMLIRIII